MRCGLQCRHSPSPDVLISDEALSVGGCLFPTVRVAAIREFPFERGTTWYLSVTIKELFRLFVTELYLTSISGRLVSEGEPEEQSGFTIMPLLSA